MSTPSRLAAITVKVRLTFTLGEQLYDIIHQDVSLYGVSGLPWNGQTPFKYLGKVVLAQIRLPYAADALNVEAKIFIEKTAVGEHMGLRFLLSEAQRNDLIEAIEKHGYYPTEYLRKYPRIPADPKIPTFPLSALATHQNQTLVFDVVNLSPSGILLKSENSATQGLKPNERLHLQLEPRGWFPDIIHADGMICRVSIEIDPVSQNTAYFFGIKFIRLEDKSRFAFIDLLRDILTRVKRSS